MRVEQVSGEKTATKQKVSNHKRLHEQNWTALMLVENEMCMSPVWICFKLVLRNLYSSEYFNWPSTWFATNKFKTSHITSTTAFTILQKIHSVLGSFDSAQNWVATMIPLTFFTHEFNNRIVCALPSRVCRTPQVPYKMRNLPFKNGLLKFCREFSFFSYC